MDWKTALIFLGLSGCGHAKFKVPFCQINVTQVAGDCDIIDLKCHDGERSHAYEIADLDGWFATDEATVRKIGAKLERCENADP